MIYNTNDSIAFIGREVGNVGNTFVFLHQNIRSLRENFDLFLVQLSTYSGCPEVIFSTEICIQNNESHLYKTANYTSFFTCNESYRLEEVAVYIHNTFKNNVSITSLNLDQQI